MHPAGILHRRQCAGDLVLRRIDRVRRLGLHFPLRASDDAGIRIGGGRVLRNLPCRMNRFVLRDGVDRHSFAVAAHRFEPELDDVMRREVTAAHRLRAIQFRRVIESRYSSFDLCPGRQHDAVVCVDRFDQRPGYRLTDFFNRGVGRQRDAQRPAPRDDQLDCKVRLRERRQGHRI